MAALGAEASAVGEFTAAWFLSSGVIISYILLLLLAVILTALCSDCGRQSFELEHSKIDRNPSALISVVKLEEAIVARENPMISEIQNDEKDLSLKEENSAHYVSWRTHLGAPQSCQGTNGGVAVTGTTNTELNTSYESSTEEEIPYTPWRSHLQPGHIYETFEEQSNTDVVSPTANHQPQQNGETGVHCEAVTDSKHLSDIKPLYAEVKKMARQTAPAVQLPEEEEEEEEGDEPSPPLPNRPKEIEE